MDMIDQLLAYDSIAWDFDGTLHDHAKSALMQAFIKNHPQKQHYIVTFRTHGDQKRVFHQLRDRYHDAPGPEHFVDVLNISDKAWEQFDYVTEQRISNLVTGVLTLPETYYMEWKGMICHRLKIPVLVDDMRDLVLPGCLKYGIDYLHPDEL
jgi:hypothetical protein